MGPSFSIIQRHSAFWLTAYASPVVRDDNNIAISHNVYCYLIAADRDLPCDGDNDRERVLAAGVSQFIGERMEETKKKEIEEEYARFDNQ